MTDATQPDAAELVACPFCGGTDTFVERATLSDCYVVCNDCCAKGPVSCDETESDADASENGDCEPGELPARRLWNRRPVPLAGSGVAGESAAQAEERIMQEWRWGNLTKLGVARRGAVARALQKGDSDDR